MSSAGKILFVCEYAGFAGGIERYIYQTAGILKRYGFEVYALYNTEVRGFAEFKSVFNGLWKYNELPQITVDFDLVTVHRVRSAEFAEVLQNRYKLVMFVHDHEYYCPRLCRYLPVVRTNCFRPYKRMHCGVCGMLRRPANGVWQDFKQTFFEFPRLFQSIKKSEKLVVLSHFMQKTLTDNGFAAEKIVIIPPAVALPEPAVPQVVPHLVITGQLIRGKGVDLFLQAARLLHGNYTADILGAGNDEEYLKSLAIGLPAVKFHGWINNPESYIQRASFAVLPWRWQEPFGLVGPEAMACGLPLVAFDVGGVREYLIDRENGILVPPGDIEKLAAAIQELIDNPAKCLELGRNGRRLVAEKFAEVNLVENYKQLMDKR